MNYLIQINRIFMNDLFQYKQNDLKVSFHVLQKILASTLLLQILSVRLLHILELIDASPELGWRVLIVVLVVTCHLFIVVLILLKHIDAQSK